MINQLHTFMSFAMQILMKIFIVCFLNSCLLQPNKIKEMFQQKLNFFVFMNKNSLNAQKSKKIDISKTEMR